MPHRGERIRRLRERAGLESEPVAEALGINNHWYRDLEAYNDEITDTLTLRQVMKLAGILCVTPRQLLAADETVYRSTEIKPIELADRVKHLLRSEGMRLDELEEKIGWHLTWFLDDPEEVLNQPAMFLQALCEYLGISWLEAIPLTTIT